MTPPSNSAPEGGLLTSTIKRPHSHHHLNISSSAGRHLRRCPMHSVTLRASSSASPAMCTAMSPGVRRGGRKGSPAPRRPQRAENGGAWDPVKAKGGLDLRSACSRVAVAEGSSNGLAVPWVCQSAGAVGSSNSRERGKSWVSRHITRRGSRMATNALGNPMVKLEYMVKRRVK
jgi:hypothetical protein